MLFVRFFQVFFLLQLFGFGQLHAHTGKASSHAFFSESQQRPAKFILNNHPSSALIITGLESHSFNQLMLEDAEDFEEDEVQDSDDQLEQDNAGKHFSVFTFCTPSFEDPYHASFTGFAFRRQLSTVLVNRKYIIFEVFRI